MHRPMRAILSHAPLLVLIVGGLCAAAPQLYHRVMVQRASSTVAIVVDYDEVTRLAAASGASVSRVLNSVSSAATHVALAERTWRDLQAAGSIEVWGRPLVPQAFIPAGYTAVNVVSWTAAQFVFDALKAKGIDARLSGASPAPGNLWSPVGRVLLVPTAALRTDDLGLGYDPAAVAQIQKAGLDIIARPRAALISNAAGVRASLELAKRAGARIVIFLGNEVVGNPGLVPTTAAAMQQLGLAFGWVEMSPQFGGEKLARALSNAVLRTHSISEPEMHNIAPGAAIQRYVRAVRERNVRVLYARFLPTTWGEADLLASNARYLQRLRQALEQAGYRAGRPQPFQQLSVPASLAALLGVGIAGLVMAALAAAGVPRAGGWLPCALAALFFGAAAYAGGAPRDAAALLGVVASAVVGLLAIRPSGESGRPLLRALGSTLVISALTVLGASISIALLSDSIHMTGILLFRGVKLSLILPPLAVLAIHVARATEAYQATLTEAGETREFEALLAGLRQALNAGVRYWHVIVAILLVAAAALLVVRSGNEPLFGLSGIELKVRAALEQSLGLRPRTKEFAFGHPLMIVGLWLAYRGRRRGTWLALSGAAVGQASMANTFCHIHSPYLLSAQRAALGLGLGVVIGLIVVAVWAAVERLAEHHVARPGRA